MITLEGYEIGKQLYQGKHSSIYRAKRASDGLPVIIKINSERYPTNKDIQMLRDEFAIGSRFDEAHVIKYLETIPHHHGLALIEEDCGAVSLSGMIPENGFDAKEFLEIAIQAADGLAAIHDKNVIHKDLHPRNMIMNPGSGEVKVIDFSISSDLSQEVQRTVSPGGLEGTLSYISPEQTGRMNRVIDYRTDMYSLGVSFYEFLSGRLPFQADDAMELIHCHIAKSPEPLHEIKPEIPVVLSDIVARLMEKNAEDRYQSAHGLKSDLSTCLRDLEANERIGYFTLGARDIPKELRIPQKLYGREKEFRTLTQALRRVSRGKTELLLVSGTSGVGKTMLVNEIQKPVTARRGYFISGKFDLLASDIAYSAIGQAFQGLVRELLTETEARVRIWRERLKNALAPNGGLIIDIIPEMELLIGKQPEIEELGPEESRNRFNYVFRNFVRVFAKKENPLALFLDDLQWADAASLVLIENLLTESGITHMLLIGAFRSDEIDPTHLFSLTLERIKKKGLEINEIPLGALNEKHMAALIADTLQHPVNKVADLAEVVNRKTGGNPFFIKKLLRTLYKDGIIHFSIESGRWDWNHHELTTADVSENVVEFMANHLRKISGDSLNTLKFGACMGNRFDLAILAVIMETPGERLADALREAVKEEIILPPGSRYRLVDPGAEPGLGNEPDVLYQFQHDRVQQAAYSLIEEKQKKSIHLRIGRLLKENKTELEIRDNIFEIVRHLNAGKTLITDHEEQIELARLNLAAGLRAKKSSAYQAASRYFDDALALMPRDAWESHYANMLSLHEELAEVEFLNGANEKVEASLDLVIQKSKDIFDSARAHQLKITYLSSTGRLRESLDVTVHALKLLGFKVPRQPSQMTIIKELIKTRIMFLGKDQETLENAPKTSSREFEAIMNIMSKAFSPAYIHEPRFFAMLNARIVRQSIRRGYASSTVMAYSAYGIVLNGVLGDVKNAYNFGLLALKLIEKLDASDMAGRCLFIFYSFILHWLKPIREMNAPLMEAAQKCMEVGDLEYFGYCMGLNIQFRIHSGENLEKLIKDYARYHLPLEQANMEIALSFVRTCGFFLYSIRDESRVEGARLIENYDEEAEGRRMAESSHFTSLCFHHLYKGIRLYLFGEYQRALGCFDKVDKLKEAISSMYASPINTFYSALALSGARRRDSHKGKRRLIAALNKKIRLLKKWAKNGPANYENKLALARAERAGVQGRRETALNLYDLAIRKAGENGFIQEEAIANECAGAYLLRSGRRKYAALHIREAALIYNKWGAKRVAEQLLERYSDLVGAPSRLDTETESIVTTIRGFTRTSSSFTSSLLDMETVMKAAMAISEEIDLGRFLKKMMKIITENTGAQNGTLILKHGERFLIQARMESATDAVEVFQKAPFEQSGDLPVSIVQYVSRTKELVLYAIDAPDEQFTRDEYIRKRRPKSILCLPIFHQNAIIGVLYLENNITANAFTEDRVQILEILLSQAAVSLQNAKLFEKSARAEEALLESKERLSMALDVSAAAVWEWEIGSDRLFFDDIDVIHDILGSGQKDLPETFKEFQTRIDPAHLDEMNALLSAYLRGKTPAYLHEHRVLKKDGEWTWVQDRAKVVEWDEDQRPVRLLGTSIDITERKEAEEEKLQLDSRLRQAQKMEAIGTLAGGIAHDFNNILFGALGFAEMVQENVEEGGRAALCAEQIMIALKRAADLVSQILTFSRQTEHKREPLRMQLVVKEALKLLRGSIPSTIEIVKNIDEECGPVLADPTQIHQVVMNLCTNAYHAMRDKGGVMRVELEEVEVGDERRGPDHGLKPGRHALLTVSDTGHGMDEDTQKRIFEPYFTTKKVGEGTGLGLATVHGIVKNHGGAMHVYSLVGQGTTFELFFPLFLKKGEVERTENLDAGLEGDEKILFVDDEEQIILFVKMALRDLGYDVRAHQNSAEALEEFVADPRRFDVVVTDQTMPHLTGEEMARRMLEIRPDLPIVLCSGFNEVLSQKKALELGIREYIRKPVLTRELARAIRRALAPAPENAEKAGSAGDTGSAGEDGSTT